MQHHTTEDEYDLRMLLMLEDSINDMSTWEYAREILHRFPHLTTLLCRDCMPKLYRHVNQLTR